MRREEGRKSVWMKQGSERAVIMECVTSPLYTLTLITSDKRNSVSQGLWFFIHSLTLFENCVYCLCKEHVKMYWKVFTIGTHAALQSSTWWTLHCWYKLNTVPSQRNEPRVHRRRRSTWTETIAQSVEALKAEGATWAFMGIWGMKQQVQNPCLLILSLWLCLSNEYASCIFNIKCR